MEQTLSWSKPTSFSEIESFGILAGEDNGQKVYVGRVTDRDGNFVPAKVVPALKAGFYVYNGKEEESSEIDFLDNATDFHWVNSKDANIEDAALVSGSYIGRGNYNGNVVVGKVDADKKQLIGSHDGEAFELPSYDVLIYKSKGVVYETIKKASNFPRQVSHHSTQQVSHHSVQQESSGFFSTQTITNGFGKAASDNSHLLSKIRQLELEKLSLSKTQQSYEESVHNQQLRINELSFQMKKLRVENLQLSKNQANVEEKYDSEQRKFSTLEQKLNEARIENSYLLKRITSLEEATKFESQMVDSYSEKSASSEAYSKTLLTKITSFEANNRTLQNRVFELESEISMTTSNSESLLKRVADYEAVIKNLRLQLETYIKKLELSRNDNEFMIQKLTVLTSSLRTYQSQIECLNNKLQESKTVIASTHADLARANAQIAKYQAAVSSCYLLNGELMTKVAAMNVSAQNQVGSDCSFNLVNHSSTSFSVGHSVKAVGYGRTASLLELTGSDLTLQANEGFTPFAPYGAQPAEKFTPFQPHEKFTPFLPFATEEPGKVAAVPLNGFSESEPAEFMDSM